MAKKINVTKNGINYFRVTRTISKNRDGSSVKKEFYGTCEADANSKATEYMNMLKNGYMPEYKEITINEIVDIFIYVNKINDENFKPGSFSKYEGIYRNYIKKSPISNLKVFYIKKIQIQNYYNELSANGKTYSQIKNLNKVLKGAFEYAIEEGYLNRNPCINISIPKIKTDKFDEVVEDNSNDFFTFEELNKIVIECNKEINNNSNDYLPYLILFALGTGLRQGEQLGLQNQYLSNKYLKVRKELSKIKLFKNKECIGYIYKLIKPKTPTSIRDVNFSEHISIIMNKYINIIKKIYLEYDKPFKKDSLIFVTNTCNYIDQSNLLKSWKRFLTKINIKYKKWHTLRKGFACLLFLNGADLKTVQYLMGHADINTTIKIYLYVFPDKRKSQVDLIDKTLSKLS